VFHPAFFNADGGYFSWSDVNGDGVLTPGTDRVLLDPAQPEGAVLVLGDTGVLNPYDQEGGWSQVHGNGKYDPGFDVLYVDSNGNGKRDFGSKFGFSDSTPGFGEPMFVADDVDGNGAVNAGEKLVMLNSSKIAKVWVGKTPYVRGVNLSELYSLDTFGTDASGYPTALHGTGVAGILVAGNPGLQRFVGMAPAATIHMYDNTHDDQSTWYDNSTLQKLVWATQDGLDILLYEFSMWGMEFMDGSSNLEVAMDKTYEQHGIINVVPAGNLGGAGKHMQTEVGSDGISVNALVPTTWQGYNYPFETPGLILSFYWKGEVDDLRIWLTPPGGPKTEVLANGPGQGVVLSGGQRLYSYSSSSVSGFVLQMLFIYDDAGKAISSGNWGVSVDNMAGSPVALHGFLMDYVAGWERTVTWSAFESDDTTMCHPSTADSAITVGAFGGQFGSAGELGRLRGYSSRGPRMDGELGLDIGAPDDPFSPLPDMEIGWAGASDILTGAYSVFGGTSGAGPHVAGTLALLAQARPDLPAPGLRQALLDGTIVEEHMGPLPNKDWGFGRLNIYKAMTGEWPAPANGSPVAKASLAWRQGLYAGLTAKDSVDPDADPLEYRWDFNYDGKWDTPWSDEGDVEYGSKEFGVAVVKLAVRDGKGGLSYALLSYLVDDQTVAPVEPEVESSEDVFTSDASGSEVVEGGGPDAASVELAEVVVDVGHDAGDLADIGSPAEVKGKGCSGGGHRGGGMAWPLVALLVALGALRLRHRGLQR